MSDTSSVGTFSIKSTAKSFSILSSGLYQNKIRAIVRELSCNASDSHAAAGKSGIPFETHLPSVFEPWFSIRDFGTGLSNEEVSSIYTTYFESTKTQSNDFVGALGLGSKSPFSYTDNFTITAIKHGRKCIYAAFINDSGLPSITKLADAISSDATGVEIKFAVTSNDDMRAFATEAGTVYGYFNPVPVISGVQDFTINCPSYQETDIIPGVHRLVSGRTSYAIMGNIAYPIEIPASSSVISDDLQYLLAAGLEINFNIGEIDFQASREGLSYVPFTLAAIHDKLSATHTALKERIVANVDAFDNTWDKVNYLKSLSSCGLCRRITRDYVSTSNLPTSTVDGRFTHFSLLVRNMAIDWNIKIVAFTKDCDDVCKSALPRHGGLLDSVWQVYINTYSNWIINDTKRGMIDRARHHYRTTCARNRVTVYMLSRHDPTRPMDTDAFFKAISNPRVSNIISNVDQLIKKDRSSSTRSHSNDIFKLTKSSWRCIGCKWESIGDITQCSDDVTYYYMPLSGTSIQSNFMSTMSPDTLYSMLARSSIPALSGITVYGVRKSLIDDVKCKKNWINIEDFITLTLTNMSTSDIEMIAAISVTADRCYQVSSSRISARSPYIEVNRILGLVAHISGTVNTELLDVYATKWLNDSISTNATRFNDIVKQAKERYPLMHYLYNASRHERADYVNLIDSQVVTD